MLRGMPALTPAMIKARVEEVQVRARPRINATPNAERSVRRIHNQRSIDSVIPGRALRYQAIEHEAWDGRRYSKSQSEMWQEARKVAGSPCTAGKN
jgi:hypothetical protein